MLRLKKAHGPPMHTEQTAPNLDRLKEQTIRDFGEQWTAFPENDGYYASLALFTDIIAPLVDTASLKGRRVAEIGSGTGRIVNMLLDAQVSSVLAIEPSEAIKALAKNTQARRERVELLQVSGENIPSDANLDMVLSIGVLHHIPDPAPVVKAAYRALRPGGQMFAWVYGHEGNELLLAFLNPLRALTRRMPHALLVALVRLIDLSVVAYLELCRRLPLPMRKYFLEVIGKFDGRVRRLTIYDQLNPAYAKYYRKTEAVALLKDAGFRDVQIYHRHGYSWSVIGTK